MNSYTTSRISPLWMNSHDDSLPSKNAAMMWLGSHFVLFHVMFLLAYQNYSINPSSGVIVSLGEFYGLYLTSHSLMIAIVLLATPVVALIVDRLATHDTPRRPNHRSLPRMTKVHKAHSQPNVYEEDQELLNIERALVKLARENKVQMPTSKMRESLSLNLTEDEFQSEWLEREQSVSH
jgi:hypothetical protein